MNIKISSVRFDADKKLLEFIEEKMKKLSGHYYNIVSSEVILKLDNTSKDTNKVVEIRLIIPGNELFSKKQATSFEEATDMSIDALKRQLSRYKSKIRGR